MDSFVRSAAIVRMTHVPYPRIAAKLLFILMYGKQHPIQEIQGQLLRIHLLHTVLNQALAHQDLLPGRPADEFAVLLVAERTRVEPGPPFWHDSMERPIPRNSRNNRVLILTDFSEGDGGKDLTGAAGEAIHPWMAMKRYPLPADRRAQEGLSHVPYPTRSALS